MYVFDYKRAWIETIMWKKKDKYIDVKIKDFYKLLKLEAQFDNYNRFILILSILYYSEKTFLTVNSPSNFQVFIVVSIH